MGLVLPWALLMGVQAYRYGIKPDADGNRKMPEPFHFFWGSAAMGICAVVAMADNRVGVVLAWGLLIGAAVVDYNKQGAAKKTAQSNANPSSQQITTRQVGIIPGDYKTV